MSTRVRLRRLIRAHAEASERLASEPSERELVALVAARLQGLTTEVREAWRRDRLAGRLADPLDRYVRDALRTLQLAIAGLEQKGADLELLRRDFEVAALPLEIFMRGLDAEPALQRSA
ncbi:hypothetical protein EPN29_03035 [bacterium]|nr:MAG: hypothetical protein EPN29_03035 [bacterium]